MANIVANSDKLFLDQYLNGEIDKNSILPNPIGAYLNARVTNVDIESYKLSMSFEGLENMLNGAGVIQGGIITAMLDITMALSVLSHVKSDNSVATISINTDFLNIAKIGVFYAEAEITRMGRNIAFTKAMLKDKEDKLIASATANFAII